MNDSIIVHFELLKKNPGIGKAIIGAWYEVMQILATPSANEIKQLLRWLMPPALVLKALKTNSRRLIFTREGYRPDLRDLSFVKRVRG